MYSVVYSTGGSDSFQYESTLNALKFKQKLSTMLLIIGFRNDRNNYSKTEQ